MNDQQNGGPAFPISLPGLGDNGASGMTLRDYFAAQSLQGLLACGIECGPKEVPIIASSCYVMADAMLRARSKL